ncbi:MAG: biotin--[acetyl-CoA-carboxylase] ligase [Gammaproteobacteria bacterium]
MSAAELARLDRLADRLIRARCAVPAQALTMEFDCTPARLLAMIEMLDALGAPVAEAADGYTLELRDPLDAEAIRAGLPQVQAATVVVRRVCVSTNEVTRTLEPPSVCVAEAQTAGRGRRGTQWKQPFGAGLALSVVAPVPRGRLDPLAIALALTAADCLESLGYLGIRLKWPNDLYAREAKLGGLMVELEGAAPGRLCLGLGLNVWSAPSVAEHRTIALAELGGSPPDRNRLAAALAGAFTVALRRYDAAGFSPFAAEFPARDWLAGHTVRLHDRAEVVTGLARGIDDSGALILDTDAGLRRCRSGEVSRVSREEEAWANA